MENLCDTIGSYVIARVKILKKTEIKRKKRKEYELFVINLGLPKIFKKELGKHSKKFRFFVFRHVLIELCDL